MKSTPSKSKQQHAYIPIAVSLLLPSLVHCQHNVSDMIPSHYPTYNPTTTTFNSTTNSSTTHYPTYEPTISFNHTNTTHYPTYEPTVSFNPTTHYPTYEPTVSFNHTNTTHYLTYEPTVSFKPTTHYPTYEPTASDSEGEGMESIPDSDSEGLGGGDQSITNITLAENGHQPDSRSLDEFVSGIGKAGKGRGAKGGKGGSNTGKSGKGKAGKSSSKPTPKPGPGTPPGTQSPGSPPPTQTPGTPPPTQTPGTPPPTQTPGSPPPTQSPGTPPPTPQSTVGGNDCSTKFCEKTIKNGLLLRYKYKLIELGSPDGTISMELVYNGKAWLGIAFSNDEKMAGSDAIIGSPDSNEVPRKYRLGTGAEIMSPEEQTLTDASVEFVNGQTVMKFTKPMVEANQISVTVGVNKMLWAHGDENTTTIGYHGDNKNSFTLDLSSE